MELELTTENNGDTGGEWSTAGSKNNKGKKQKKKFKNNARTVTLQTFISENGGPVDPQEDFRDDEGSSPVVDLSEEEQVVQNSLITVFTDMLRRLGPVRLEE